MTRDDWAKIFLKNSSQASRDIPWTMKSQNHVSSNGARLFNFKLKILVIKWSGKLSGLSVSLTGWIKAFLLRVFKVFYKSRDLFFFIS